MLLDLSRMHGERDHFDRSYPASVFEQAGEAFAVAAPVHVVFDIFKSGAKFRLVGTTATALELTCSRCLDDYRWPVETPFDLLYLPQAENVGDGEVEVEDEDLNTAYYQDDEIDLGHLIREQLYLAVPMKPLCREDCRGLCPECGTNWNKATCRCRHEWADPRLNGLRSMLGGDGRTDH
jgi:uncharacterized protein